ncbi:MAG: hypothetical protein Kow0099_20550 [Candidatus Abyssubacteria bacterium]
MSESHCHTREQTSPYQMSRPDSYRRASIAVIIPAFNEEASIGKVLAAIPLWVDDIIVVDNGSTDGTAEVARSHGARVISEGRRGYGSACLAGMAALGSPDVVVFLDGDFSDYPEQIDRLVDPILRNEAEMVIGSRLLGRREPGALTPQAVFGNWLACTLMRWLWRVSYTDLGPFRALSMAALKRLDMQDRNYGWTVEMQIKAARHGLRVRETPVDYRCRIGRSKVSGTVRGVIGAGAKILFTIFKYALESLRRKTCERVIVFTRYPEPGSTKTRLIPALGPDGAAALHTVMTEHTLRRVRDLAEQRPVSIEVRYEGGDKRLVKRWLGPGIIYRRQASGDLGQRMARAFNEAFEDGMERVILVGTDCPEWSSATLRNAFESIERKQLVLGPANDGGYYLIGLSRMFPQLFDGLPWGADDVCERTLQLANKHHISTALVEKLSDVDRVDDLEVWENARRCWASARRISVIVPTLNEAATLADSLASIGDMVEETLVVDGGSTDDTLDIAASFGARILHIEPCRARQMNVGAAAACGDILLFLHADTRLPCGFADQVRFALEQPGVVGGAFELSIDSPSPLLRMVEHLANWRSRRMGMPYGDQAIFLDKGLFFRMGGFPDVPIMEDFEFMRRLRRRGRVALVASPIVTSARRWHALGPMRTTLINQAVIAAYYGGVSLHRISRWYRDG